MKSVKARTLADISRALELSIELGEMIEVVLENNISIPPNVYLDGKDAKIVWRGRVIEKAEHTSESGY